jgi:hypothetical protein
MQWRRTGSGYLLRLLPGEEVIESLIRFLRLKEVASGALSGIGALAEVELGYFRRGDRTYTRRAMSGEWELLSLTGNAARVGGEPFIHTHVVLGDDSFRTVGGHLFRGVVTVTVEIVVYDWGADIERVRDPDLGLLLLALDPEPPAAAVPSSSTP